MERKLFWTVVNSLIGMALVFSVFGPPSAFGAGKTLKAILTSLDDFDFQNARWDSIVVALFSAGLEKILQAQRNCFAADDFGFRVQTTNGLMANESAG